MIDLQRFLALDKKFLGDTYNHQRAVRLGQERITCMHCDQTLDQWQIGRSFDLSAKIVRGVKALHHQICPVRLEAVQQLEAMNPNPVPQVVPSRLIAIDDMIAFVQPYLTPRQLLGFMAHAQGHPPKAEMGDPVWEGWIFYWGFSDGAINARTLDQYDFEYERGWSLGQAYLLNLDRRAEAQEEPQ